MTRDSEQSDTYAGENMVRLMLDEANRLDGNRCVTLAGSTVTLPVERKFASLESIQSYCNCVLRTTVVAHPVRPVRVRGRKGDTKATYCNGVIAVPLGDRGTSRWALRELVVIHELAHHLAPGHQHDATFRTMMAELANEAMSPEVALALRVAWDGVGLK